MFPSAKITVLLQMGIYVSVHRSCMHLVGSWDLTDEHVSHADNDENTPADACLQ